MEKNGLEVRRQLFHLFLGITILVLLFFGFVGVKFLVVVFFIGLILSLLSLKFRIPLVSWFLVRFERPGVFPGKGALFFFLGSILVLFLFPKNVALASIAILTFGDSLAPVAGIYLGRVRSRLNGRRFVEGFVIGFVFAVAAAAFFVPLIPALLGSFAALGFEFLELKFNGFSVDDNLMVPLIAGAVIYLFSVL